jgi:hypothetical protein
MKIYRYPDGSESYLFENGDEVTLKTDDIHGPGLFSDTPKGTPGIVTLKECKDKRRGYAGIISFVHIHNDHYWVAPQLVSNLVPAPGTYEGAELIDTLP